MSVVFDWAKSAGHRTGDNPANGVDQGLPKQQVATSHMAALPYSDVPGFIENLRASDASETVRLAFEFLILTASRTNEVINARWDEVDLEKGVWTIPAARMKAKREHRVPLSAECIAILQRMKAVSSDTKHIFPSRGSDTPLSNMAFLMTLRRMKLDVTAHGFRSSFRDWASERTNFPNEVCELALAHTVKNKVEAAYRRGDQLAKRRELMTAWAGFATNKSAQVVKLRA
jgi:integrase